MENFEKFKSGATGQDQNHTSLQHAELFLKLARNPCEYFHTNFDENKNSTKLCHSKNTQICRKFWMGKTCICKDDFTGTYCSEIVNLSYQSHGHGNDTLMNGSGKRNVFWPVMLYIFLVLIYV